MCHIVLHVSILYPPWYPPSDYLMQSSYTKNTNIRQEQLDLDLTEVFLAAQKLLNLTEVCWGRERFIVVKRSGLMLPECF